MVVGVTVTSLEPSTGIEPPVMRSTYEVYDAPDTWSRTANEVSSEPLMFLYCSMF